MVPDQGVNPRTFHLAQTDISRFSLEESTSPESANVCFPTLSFDQGSTFTDVVYFNSWFRRAGLSSPSASGSGRIGTAY